METPWRLNDPFEGVAYQIFCMSDIYIVAKLQQSCSKVTVIKQQQNNLMVVVGGVTTT